MEIDRAGREIDVGVGVGIDVDVDADVDVAVEVDVDVDVDVEVEVDADVKEADVELTADVFSWEEDNAKLIEGGLWCEDEAAEWLVRMELLQERRSDEPRSATEDESEWWEMDECDCLCLWPFDLLLAPLPKMEGRREKRPVVVGSAMASPVGST